VVRHDACTGERLGELEHGGALAGPQAIRIGPDGRLWVVSEKNHRVLRFDADDGTLVDVVLDDPRLANPTALDFAADGTPYVGSYGGDAVWRVEDGDLVPVLRGGDVDGVDSGMAFGPDGRLWIPGFESDVLLVVDPATRRVERRLTEGLASPRMLLFEADGASVTIGSWRNDRLYTLDLTDPDAQPVLRLERLRPSGLARLPGGDLLTVSDVRPPVHRVVAGSRPPRARVFADDADLAAVTFLAVVPRLGAAP
jgi:outer membrane protein assembly factor BamB